MIIGTGCDIIEIKRVAEALKEEGFRQRVFTDAEIDYCISRGKQQDASFAVRFAAKEAVLKAFGTGLRGGKMKEMEILSDSLGKPEVKLSGYFANLAMEKGVKKIAVTLSHSRDNAMAYIVMESL
ncbi:MAG: holo-ACP synthase [Phascolarctobacterium sp.]|nr:holo-ACP synthase [Phascolarctobacterium sp.]